MKVIVDVGGGSIKMAQFRKGKIEKYRTYSDITSYQMLEKRIKETADGFVTGIAVSTAGIVDSQKGVVKVCSVRPFMKGNIIEKLKKSFPFARCYVINDGEAHARALLSPERNVKFGAIHFSFGTSVSLGVIDEKGQIVRNLQGENWEVGHFRMMGEGINDMAWYHVGSTGLTKLEEEMGKDAYYYHGCNIGKFLTNFACVFCPRTIGLSGGVIENNESEIMRGIKDSYAAPKYHGKTEFVIITDSNPAMEGLTTLFK